MTPGERPRPTVRELDEHSRALTALEATEFLLRTAEPGAPDTLWLLRRHEQLLDRIRAWNARFVGTDIEPEANGRV
jgi:hypothetical protein